MRRTGENEPVDTAFGPAKAQKEWRSAKPIEPIRPNQSDRLKHLAKHPSQRTFGECSDSTDLVTRFARKDQMFDEKRKELQDLLIRTMYTDTNVKRGIVQIGILQRTAIQHGFSVNDANREIEELITRGDAETHSLAAIGLTYEGLDRSKLLPHD